MEPIRIVIPKGSLTERLLGHLGTGGYSLHSPNALGCCGAANGIEFELFDRREVPNLVRVGAFHAGLTGQDIELNCRTELRMHSCFGFARNTDQPTKWVLAAKKGFVLTRRATIGCELPVFAKQVLSERSPNQRFRIRRIEGSEEAMVHYGVVDAALIVTETGSSLRAWDLEIVDGFDELFFSHPALFTVGEPNEDLAIKLEELSLALQAVTGASNFVELIFNFPKSLDINSLGLPADQAPTIRRLSKPDWLAGSIVIPRSQFPGVQRLLKTSGAAGINMKEVQGHLM